MIGNLFIYPTIAMKYTVCIFYSTILNQYYIGHTYNLSDRIFRHNNSGSKATKKVKDWKIVYTEMYDTKSDAYKIEMQRKSMQSRKYIEALINKTS